MPSRRRLRSKPGEEVEVELAEAIEFAETSPNPAPEELFKDIYVEVA